MILSVLMRISASTRQTVKRPLLFTNGARQLDLDVSYHGYMRYSKTLSESAFFNLLWCFFRCCKWAIKILKAGKKSLLGVLSVMWIPHRLAHTDAETDMTQQRSWSNLKWFSAAICPLLGLQPQPHILLASQKSVKYRALMLSLSHNEIWVL